MDEDDWMSSEPDERLRLSDLGKLARRGRRRVLRVARAGDRPGFARLLADHLDAHPEQLDVVEESWPAYELVNVQIGLEAWLSEPGRSHELVGMRGHRHMEFGLTDLLHGDEFGHGPAPGNVSWTNLASGPGGETHRAVRSGLYLISDAESRAAVMVLGADPESGRGMLELHVVADREGVAAQLAADIRELATRHNVFRGHVISFGGGDMFGERSAALQFHPRPVVPVDDVILPAETLATIR